MPFNLPTIIWHLESGDQIVRFSNTVFTSEKIVQAMGIRKNGKRVSGRQMIS